MDFLLCTKTVIKIRPNFFFLIYVFLHQDFILLSRPISVNYQAKMPTRETMIYPTTLTFTTYFYVGFITIKPKGIKYLNTLLKISWNFGLNLSFFSFTFCKICVNAIITKCRNTLYVRRIKTIFLGNEKEKKSKLYRMSDFDILWKYKVKLFRNQISKVKL